MADAKVVGEWLAKADEDFGFASVCLDDLEEAFFAQICFHFQQAAEKYLKAYIVAFDLPFEKTHDLTALLQTCVGKEGVFEALRPDGEFLTDFYVETRYPVHWPTQINRAEALQAREACSRIREMAQSLLKTA